MNIGVFTDSYRPYVSGVVRSIDTFSTELLELGHKVYIFGPRYYPSHGDGGMSTDASDETVPATKVFRYWSIPVPMYRGFTAPVPISTHAEEVVTDLGIDIIHSHTPFAMGTLGALLARRLNLPLVFTHHTMYHEYVHYLPGGRTALREMMLRYVGNYCRRADLVIAPTPQIREFAVETYGLDSQFVHAIPTGIDIDEFRRGDGAEVRKRFNIPDDDLVLTFVGRLGREKNVDFLVKAFQRIADERDDVHLLLVGDGPRREHLEEMVGECGLSARVHFTGTLQKHEVIDAYHSADVFVIASTTETQGLATLEAMAAGLPVVGVKAPGTRDMVEHEGQGLLTEEDSTTFARAVLQLLGDDDLRRSYARRALERSEKFSARNMALELVKAYEKVRNPNEWREKDGRDQAVAME